MIENIVKCRISRC